MTPSTHSHVCRFLNTLLPAAGSATTTFFPSPVAAPAIAGPFFIALVVLAVTAGRFAGPTAVFFTVVITLPGPVAFLTTVVEVLVFELVEWVLDWLTVRCSVADDEVANDAVPGRAGGSILPGPPAAVPVVVLVFSREAVRDSLPAVALVPRLACSTMPWKEAEIAVVAAVAAVLKGEAGLSGETGRAMLLCLYGEEGRFVPAFSLIGERRRVRELWERGERTLFGLLCLETWLPAGPAFGRLWFFAMANWSSAASFSLSDAMVMSSLLRFLDLLELAGAGRGRSGLEGFEDCACGTGGRGLSRIVDGTLL